MRFLLACLLLLVLAAPASAAGVISRTVSAPAEYVYAGGDEDNELTVSDPDAFNVRFHDPRGITIDTSVAGRCNDVNATTVDCTRTAGPVTTRINVELGNGNDALVDTDVVPKRIDGGPGWDTLTLGPAADTVTGGAGDDTLIMMADGVADEVRGGTGIDTIAVANPGGAMRLSLDGAADDAGGTDNLHADVEDIMQAGISTAADALTGSAEVNSITGGDGDETIDGGGAGDLIDARAGNDTVNSRDGAADRIVCGNGTDTVNADQLDVVSDSCEAVNRADVPPAGGGGAGGAPADDAPPTVAFTAAGVGSLKATAGDDRGVARVVFMAADAIVCTDTAAPYECSFAPAEADVGRTTFTAIAIDTAGQTATATRTVAIPRLTTSLTAAARPARDRRAPYAFTISGRLTGAKTCSGQVTVATRGARRTVKLKADCTYRARLTVKRKARRLNVTASFTGTTVLAPAKARAVRVRAG